ncbi:MAG: inorganic polyphosphate kinase [Geobacteraceae bacterium]|jgi:NAD+ kinase|nr:inorganic polyphosphate kinase [Geobacteraceae bacterium]
MKKIGIFAKILDPRCQGVAGELVRWLRERGLIPLVEENLARGLGLDDGLEGPLIAPKADMIVVLGGDGTLISVARLVGAREVPIMGVNLGSLGFLTEITLEGLYPALESYLNCDYNLSERMMLKVTLQRDGEAVYSHEALNDIVINKGAPAKIITLEAFVNGSFLATFKADGLILASPTGSTGYSLSANGPIIDPSIDCIVITPICPHTLTNRPLVVAPERMITVTLDSKMENVMLTIDGQVGIKLEYRDVITVQRSEHRTRLVMSSDTDYFEVLRNKLKWGER